MSSDKLLEPVVVSIEQMDAAISEGPIPALILSTLTSFERRFLDVCPIHGHLLHIKQFYREHPVVEQKFKARREKQLVSKSVPQSYFRKGFEKVFEEINTESRGLFGRDKVKRFLDLGFSPGGFSNWLLTHNPNANGVGITLPDEHAKFPLAIEGTSLSEPRYRVHFESIITYTLDFISKGQNPVVPLVADEPTDLYDVVIAGAFPTLEGHVPWWLRIQLVLSQVLIILCNIDQGGNSVIVMNTKPFRWAVEVTRILRLCFEEVIATKGKTLHEIRTSCYLICRGFNASAERRAEFTGSLRRVMMELERIGEERRLQPGAEGSETGETRLGVSGLSFGGGRSEYDTPLLFPDSDEELFESEGQFLLGLLQPLWAAQYNAIHDDLRQTLYYNPVCQPSPPSSNGDLPSPPQSPSTPTIWHEASRRPSVSTSSPPFLKSSWRTSPSTNKPPNLVTDLRETPHTPVSGEGLPTPTSPATPKWRPPQRRKSSMIASSPSASDHHNWRARNASTTTNDPSTPSGAAPVIHVDSDGWMDVKPAKSQFGLNNNAHTNRRPSITQNNIANSNNAAADSKTWWRSG